ncbi:hypothetical protein QFC21_006935 [Naganishia friedmannii]|uniref:Uncharacterized protein n=1 Tax=Naganishia friedmannii TaxID=89922 RepID=A0ACC2UZT5_9TREE|nr:hypothetical protein QFC21_006935 [Naganishia friedmannii]
MRAWPPARARQLTTAVRHLYTSQGRANHRSPRQQEDHAQDDNHGEQTGERYEDRRQSLQVRHRDQNDEQDEFESDKNEHASNYNAGYKNNRRHRGDDDEDLPHEEDDDSGKREGGTPDLTDSEDEDKDEEDEEDDLNIGNIFLNEAKTEFAECPRKSLSGEFATQSILKRPHATFQDYT